MYLDILSSNVFLLTTSWLVTGRVLSLLFIVQLASVLFLRSNCFQGLHSVTLDSLADIRLMDAK